MCWSNVNQGGQKSEIVDVSQIWGVGKAVNKLVNTFKGSTEWYTILLKCMGQGKPWLSHNYLQKKAVRE